MNSMCPSFSELHTAQDVRAGASGLGPLGCCLPFYLALRELDQKPSQPQSSCPASAGDGLTCLEEVSEIGVRAWWERGWLCVRAPGSGGKGGRMHVAWIPLQG